jgi:hypothetical protein
MKSTDFLKLAIDNLVNENPSIKCRYEFDVHSCAHLIEVTPFSVYESNEKYVENESEIIFSFIDNFPNENICFISNDSLVKISNPSYVKIGVLFATMNWIPSFEQRFDQIVPIQKEVSFHEKYTSKFEFWDENKDNNNYKSEPITFVNNYTFQMAA